MRFHAVQTAPVWLDAAENRRRIESMLVRLAPSAGDFAVLPEMCETGWTSNADALRAVVGSVDWISSLARRHQVWVQAGFGEHAGDGRIANSVAIADPSGSVRAIYRKNFLFPSERDAFVVGTDLVVLDIGAAKVCPLICYDLRFPELWRLASRAGAEVFTLGSAWPSVRHEHWRALLVARAIENQAYVFAANRCGTDPSHVYAGGSVAIDPLGVRLVEADAEEQIVSLAFDRARLDEWRAKFGALRDRRDSLLGSIDVRSV
jgi:predicted amidohydrolase